MKIIFTFILALLLLSCSSDNKRKNENKTEAKILEERKDSTIGEIDSLKKELRKLERKRDSLKAIDPDTLSNER